MKNTTDDLGDVQPKTPAPRKLGDLVNKLIDSERLVKEGATLKNVSDNLRSLTVLVAMFVVIVAALKMQHPLFVVAGVLWGVWISWYMFLAVAQTSLLCMLALADGFIGPEIHKWPERQRDILLLVLACVTLFFAYCAIFVLLVSFKIVGSH
jgi:hypothetical protein